MVCGTAARTRRSTSYVNQSVRQDVAAVVPLDTWSFVAASYDGTTIKLYLNGQLVGERAYAEPLLASSEPLRIGSDTSGFNFAGSIDEVALFRRALGQTELEQLFRSSQSSVTGGSVKIELLQGNGDSLVQVIGAAVDNSGEFEWDIPATLPAADDYRLRVTANSGTRPAGKSASYFRIVPAGDSYYVNDLSIQGDQYTTAPGNNDQSGKSPDRPMASLTALLATYDLGPGDTVFVDSGVYAGGTVRIGPPDAGLAVVGPTNGNRGLFLRGNHDAGPGADPGIAALEVLGANAVTIRSLSFSGGYHGFRALDADDLTLTDCAAFDNAHTGLHVDAQTTGPRCCAIRPGVRRAPKTPISHLAWRSTGPSRWWPTTTPSRSDRKATDRWARTTACLSTRPRP